jgi:hypothetical protein
LHTLRTPPHVSPALVGLFLLVLACSALVFLGAAALLQKCGLTLLDEQDAQLSQEALMADLKQAPWGILLIPAGDGFFLLPLAYIGITPFSAAVAAVLFAAAHYPQFNWPFCIPKSVAYFCVALFLLPYGIWSIVTAHLLVDLALFTFMFLGNGGHQPGLARFVRLLRGPFH